MGWLPLQSVPADPLGEPWNPPKALAMEITLVFLIVAAAMALFATEKLSVDLVALLVLGALVATGLVSAEQAISGFGNPATVTVAAMFVLSAGLSKTGALSALGQWLVRFGKNETLLLLMIMLGMAAVSPFINNTAAVAVFLPLVMGAAASRNVSSSRLLIPLSFASQFGGVCTLVGTSTNLLVNSIAERRGLNGFGMFEFTPLGLCMVAAGVLYFLVLGRWLLPRRRSAGLTENYELGEYITELRVMKGSPLLGRTVVGAKLGEVHDITVLEILRDGRKIWSPTYEPLREGDLLLVRGAVKQLFKLKENLGLELESKRRLEDQTLAGQELELVEALLPPQSRLVGRTLRGLDFHWRYKTVVLALHRRGQTLREKLATARLRVGDALLLLGPRNEIARLRKDDNFVVLEARGDVTLDRRKAPLALGIVALVVALAALKVLPIVATALMGCVALVLTRCLRVEEAYRAIDWKIIVLLAGVLPLGGALEQTGAARFLVDQALHFCGDASPIFALGTVYLLTAVLTEFMSNNAAAVVVASVAISLATSLGVDPRPFLVAVTFAASTSFATPVGYQTNTMVYNAGGYRFTDFLKVGIPLNLIFFILATWLIPKFWPL
jgi:di/tricarboxylate transporter